MNPNPILFLPKTHKRVRCSFPCELTNKIGMNNNSTIAKGLMHSFNRIQNEPWFFCKENFEVSLEILDFRLLIIPYDDNHMIENKQHWAFGI